MMKAGWAMLTISSMPKEIETPIVHRGVEAAEQHAGHDGVAQQVEREVHVYAGSPSGKISPTGNMQCPVPGNGHRPSCSFPSSSCVPFVAATVSSATLTTIALSG